MHGCGKDLGGWAAFHDLAFVENRDALADSSDRWQVVRDIKDRHSGLAIQIGEELKNFRLRDHIKRARRLIGNEQCWTMHDGHCDQHALRLSNAKLRGMLPKKVRIGWQADARQVHAGLRARSRLRWLRERDARAMPPEAVCES